MKTTEYMRVWRIKNREKIRAYNREYNRKWREKHGTKKDLIRAKVQHELNMGRMIKQPCEVCGEKEVEAHHDNYRFALKISWLCLIHHRERDVKMKKRKY